MQRSWADDADSKLPFPVPMYRIAPQSSCLVSKPQCVQWRAVRSDTDEGSINLAAQRGW